ncbi:TonB-dependent receptor plug domain-containing protein [Pseudomonas sp. FME51]|uniref:TonB-dependent receptor plug domain-containing protein n=1 Tax=Pseudomonas sp. FME51 TaxID=2742609 RepID=UPI0018684BB6|nr:TonB-dependent receptor plug domain-containing protein [Pseudomonas sp. FME51]
MSRSHSAVFAASPLALLLCLALPVTAARAMDADVQPHEQETEAADAASLKLGDVLVKGQRRNYEGSREVDREQIEKMPAGNGDITSLLRTNPAVQFDNSQLNSKTPGEISPANISINGQPHWQNLFTLDGMGMNNDLDPGNTANNASELPGRSQGLAIDTDLLDSIIVHDSNVPASFGGFNGGVVDARTRDPKRELSGKLSLQMSRSEWTEYHLDENDPNLDEFDAALGTGNQPEFDKIITRATLEGYLTDNVGLLGSFSRKQSTIPTRIFGLTHDTPEANQQQDRELLIDNYFLKAVWDINPALRLTGSLTHAPEEDRGYGSNARSSYRVTTAGGDAFNLALDWKSPLGLISQKLGWSDQQNARDSGADYMRIWRSSESKNWSGSILASEGGFGDIEQVQKGLSYQVDMHWNTLRTGPVSHQLQTGIALDHQRVHFERTSPHYSNALNKTAPTDWCAPNDPWCSVGDTVNGWPGQYMTEYSMLEAGEVEFSTRQWAVYLQDDIQYKRLSLRPGVRVDSDNYMDQTTISPRFAAELDVRGNGNTLVTLGANRYYGRNLYTYRLRESLEQMEISYNREDQNAPWIAGERSPAGSKFSQLDIPYNDELSLAFSHIRWSTRFTLKYVERKARDQVSRAWGSQIGQPSEDPDQLKSNYYTYYNGGQSDSEIWSLTISPMLPLQLRNSWTTFDLAIDWSDINSSGLNDYTSSIGMLWVDDPLIMYDGSAMRYSERPADNYNRPWTVRLATTTVIPEWDLSWTNFFRHRSGYRRVAMTGQFVEHQGDLLREWMEQDYGSTLTWDTRISWEKPVTRKQAAFVNLDVTNLLNKRIASTADKNSIGYEVGRQFMVEVGYRF